MNGRRRDTRFMCTLCKVALCRVGECSRKYHNLLVYYTTPAHAVLEGRAGRRNERRRRMHLQ